MMHRTDHCARAVPCELVASRNGRALSRLVQPKRALPQAMSTSNRARTATKSSIFAWRVVAPSDSGPRVGEDVKLVSVALVIWMFEPMLATASCSASRISAAVRPERLEGTLLAVL